MALTKEHKSKLVQDFGKTGTDTGSAEVQIAMLTDDIKLLTQHCTKNFKDFSSKRGLLKKVSRRKKLLSYLKNNDEQQYIDITKRLGLKRR